MLVIHNSFWAHYKAKIFSELYLLVKQNPNDDVLVLQIALNELSRANLGEIDYSIHRYRYDILFKDYYENTSLISRLSKSLAWIRKYKPDVVNLPGYYEPAMNILLFYCRMKGIKVVISSDSTESDQVKIWWKEAIKRFIISKADGFFCYGSKSAAYILKLGAKSNQILLANNAVDNETISEVYQKAWIEREIAKQALHLKKYNFVYVGRLIPYKNLLNLLKAFAQLNQSEWGMILVGDGEEELVLKKYMDETALTGICFIEGQQWYDVPKFLALGDVFVLPSYSEPWGLVVNEAMAAGMPVIVSEKCGSAPDLVIDGENGFTFNPYEISEMTQKMEHFIQNPAVIPIFGEKSKEIIKKFSPEQVAKEMYQGFETLVSTD